MSARTPGRGWLRTLLLVLAVLVLAGRFGLPALLHAFGLHPEFAGRSYELEGRRALIVATNQDTLGDTGKATGVASSELTAPYYEFLDAGMDVDLASVRGGRIPVDPQTLLWLIRVTPQHPETELRQAGARFESNTAFRDIFADHVVVDGNLVTGQNQNSGTETAQRMMQLLVEPPA